jgi:hypothetical protein
MSSVSRRRHIVALTRRRTSLIRNGEVFFAETGFTAIPEFDADAQFEAAETLEEQQPELGSLVSEEAWISWSEKLLAHYERQGPHCALSALMSQLDPNESAVRPIIAEMYEAWERAPADGVRALQTSGESSSLLPEVPVTFALR